MPLAARVRMLKSPKADAMADGLFIFLGRLELVLKEFAKLRRRAAIVSLTFAVVGICAAAQVVVTDTMNRPLAGVLVQRVEVNALQLPPGEHQWQTVATTKADGRFTAEQATTRSLVILSKAGYATRALDPQQELPERVALFPGVDLVGIVLNEKGTFISDVLVGPVHLMQEQPDPNAPEGEEAQPLTAPLWAMTNANGEFRIRGLYPGLYGFLAQAPGYVPRLDALPTELESSVTLVTAATTITGVLLGSRDRLPKPGVYVEAASLLFHRMRLYSRTGPRGEFTFPPLPKEHDWRFKTASVPTEEPSVAKVVNEEWRTGDELTLLQNQGVSVGGTVIDALTSSPIADLELQLHEYNTADHMTTRSGPDGSFLFSNVDAFRQYSLRFDGSPYVFFTPVERRWIDMVGISTEDGIDLTTLSINLLPRMVVRGRVVGPAKRALPGAQVHLRSQVGLEEGFDEIRRTMTYSVTSDAEGRFITDVFPPGNYDVWAEANALASAPVIHEATTSSKVLFIELKPKIRLHGSTTDSDGNELDGVRVEVSADAGDEDSSASVAQLLKSARTDAEGRFLIEGVFPNTIIVTASHPMYADPVTTEVTVSEVVDRSVDLQFPAANVFSARVTDETAAPVEAVTIQLETARGSDEASSVTKLLSRITNAEGRADFHLNATRIHRVVTSHPDYAVFTATNITLPDRDYQIRLKSHPSIFVRLKGPPGTPEEDLRHVVYLLRGGSAGDSADQPQPNEFVSVKEQQAVDGRVLFKNVEPGWYKVATSTDTEFIYSESKPVRVKPDSALTEVQLRIASGASLEGKVTDEETGEPIAGVEVSVQLQSGTPMDFEVISKPTDAQGRYKIAMLPGAAMILTAKHPEYGDRAQTITFPETGAVTVDLALGKARSSVVGLVTLDEKPLANATLVMYRNSDMSMRLGSAVSDEQGRYGLDDIPEGARWLVAEALWENGEMELRRSQPVLIKGRSAEANVDFRRLVRVSGRVHMDTDNQDPNRVVVLWFSSRTIHGHVRRTQVNVHGDYEVFLETGQYTVGLMDGPGLMIDVPGNARETTVNFDYQTLSEASGMMSPAAL